MEVFGGRSLVSAKHDRQYAQSGSFQHLLIAAHATRREPFTRRGRAAASVRTTSGVTRQHKPVLYRHNTMLRVLCLLLFQKIL